MTSIDIAAKALAKARDGTDDYEALPAERRTALKQEVRAVLQALHDPDENVTAAGAEIIRNVHQGESEHAFRSDAANTWRFMVDAILADG